MRIHAIQTGRVQIKAAQIEGRGHGLWRQLQPIISHEWAEWTPVYAWAIEHPEGVIVVDTGSGAHLKRLPRWHPYFQFAVRFDIEPEQEMGPQLRSLGIGAGDVKTVVLTHLHVDHDGGLTHFPRSRIFADGDEIARTAGISGAILGYLPSRWPKWFNPQPLAWQPSRYGPFARSARITDAGDIIAVPSPGHTPEPHLRPCARRRRADHAGRRCVYLESTMLRGIVDGVSPDETYRKGDARRYPRIVCRAPDDLFADARSAIGRTARERRVATIGDRAGGGLASHSSTIDGHSATPI